MFVYIIFNVFAAVGIYWLARVPKGKKYAGKNKERKKELIKTESHADEPVGGNIEKGAVVGSGEMARSADDPSPKKGENVGAAKETSTTETREEATGEKSPPPVGQAAAEPRTEQTVEAGASVATTERPATQRFVTASEF